MKLKLSDIRDALADVENTARHQEATIQELVRVRDLHWTDLKAARARIEELEEAHRRNARAQEGVIKNQLERIKELEEEHRVLKEKYARYAGTVPPARCTHPRQVAPGSKDHALPCAWPDCVSGVKGQHVRIPLLTRQNYSVIGCGPSMIEVEFRRQQIIGADYPREWYEWVRWNE